MSAQFSELVEISKLNGDFKKNYGTLIGAYLYLRSISAVRGRSFFCDWLDLDCLVGCAGLVGEARRGLVTRLTDRTSASKWSKRWSPRLTRVLSLSFMTDPIISAVGNSTISWSTT